MMNDQVRYQLERAEDALRQALKFGAETETPILLTDIVATINKIKSWHRPYQYNLTTGIEDGKFKFTLTDQNPATNNIPCSFVNSGVRGGMAEDLINLS